MKKTLLIIAIFLLTATTISCTADSRKNTIIKDINTTQLLELQQQGAIIIDVRTPGEWNETGIIPGAKKAMYFNQQMQPVEDQFLKELNSIISKTDKPVVLYCRSGGRSGKAAKLIAEKNLVKNVYSLDGGIKQWLSEGKSTEK
jgi:rhodanese-related sulfurtransferase